MRNKDKSKLAHELMKQLFEEVHLDRSITHDLVHMSATTLASLAFYGHADLDDIFDRMKKAIKNQKIELFGKEIPEIRRLELEID